MRIAALAVVATAGFLAGCGRGSGGKDWKDHKGDIPFLVGQAAGMRAVTASRKPPMYLFTATW